MAAKIAVLMATHNDGDVLYRSLDSILSTTLDVDVIVVDDASLFPVELPERFKEKVELFRIEDNVGLTKALNVGLDIISRRSYDFVARMDADDICRPGRFENQLRFLSDNPRISGVGCWARFIAEDTGDVVFHFSPPCSPEEISSWLHLNSPLLHPSWMLSSSVFRDLGGYNENYTVAQDYEFLFRATRAGYLFANIPDYLVDYQITSSGVSVKRRRKQLSARLSLQLKYFDVLELKAWYGLFKTIALFGTPMSLIEGIKKRTRRHAKV